MPWGNPKEISNCAMHVKIRLYPVGLGGVAMSSQEKLGDVGITS